MRALLAVGVAGWSAVAGAADLVWPTPNRPNAAGGAYADFVQPTESGLTESGMFGCVRTSRQQFHEGLDLRSIQRDRRGEAMDPVFAMLEGIVSHVNAAPGASNYGRYLVLEHREDGLNFISLYAHLASLAPAAQPGAMVAAGDTLGILGRSAGSSPIPRERAHVHVEMGFWLSRGFQRWYDAKKFPNRNEHGVFNGMNLVGFDLLDYVERRRAGEVQSVRDYVTRLPVAVTVIVRGAQVPDFVERYPALVAAPPPVDGIAAWQIDFTWYGLPFAWRPLGAAELSTKKDLSAREIAFADTALLARYPCQKVVRSRGGQSIVGPRLEEALDLLFTRP